MLQIPLTPAAVPLGVVDQVFRTFLEAALQVRIQPHGPACARHQGRLDVIVAQDRAPEGRTPRNLGQPAALREGADTDDGIVPPERPCSSL